MCLSGIEIAYFSLYSIINRSGDFIQEAQEVSETNPIFQKAVLDWAISTQAGIRKRALNNFPIAVHRILVWLMGLKPSIMEFCRPLCIGETAVELNLSVHRLLLC